ncbi:hypothetical protein A3860_23155 [Niastella vici]|uniref:UspA domain-containing protein n=1 Tax=Niastella vici TaxID=1703345 RepID=A0A1V9FZP4_9BACT|nr:universal stress protein [Niastella vici]OQP63839.1 hypothetical protein A3860_23155 [Niastella vici]
MKTILVATDFSDAAHSASLYAVELAKAFNARIILFNAFQQVPVPVSEIPVLTMEEMAVRVERQLEEEKKLLGEGNDVPIELFFKPGVANRIIPIAIKEKKADIIITGMKKDNTTLRHIFGSTVSQLVKNLVVPMIVVPEDTTYTSISTIALANESDVAPDSDVRLLDTLRLLGERFHSKLYLVRVAENRFQEAYEMLNRPFKISRMVRTLDPIYECIVGKDVPGALKDFISGYKINLLALLTHKQGLWERLFMKSTTRTMIFETPVPLLILPDRYTDKTQNPISEKGALL